MEIKETTISLVENLLNFSSSYFLPSKKDKTFNALNFCQKFEKEACLKLFVLKIDKKSVGYISLIIHDNVQEIDIGPMFVLPEYSGKGYGKIQVEYIFKWAKENNYKLINTRTWGQNISSRKILESFGFMKISEKLNDRVDGDSTVYYKLNL